MPIYYDDTSHASVTALLLIIITIEESLSIVQYTSELVEAIQHDCMDQKFLARHSIDMKWKIP